jgi:hypothetical protein
VPVVSQATATTKPRYGVASEVQLVPDPSKYLMAKLWSSFPGLGQPKSRWYTMPSRPTSTTETPGTPEERRPPSV